MRGGPGDTGAVEERQLPYPGGWMGHGGQETSASRTMTLDSVAVYARFRLRLGERSGWLLYGLVKGRYIEGVDKAHPAKRRVRKAEHATID